MYHLRGSSHVCLTDALVARKETNGKRWMEEAVANLALANHAETPGFDGDDDLFYREAGER